MSKTLKKQNCPSVVRHAIGLLGVATLLFVVGCDDALIESAPGNDQTPVAESSAGELPAGEQPVGEFESPQTGTPQTVSMPSGDDESADDSTDDVEATESAPEQKENKAVTQSNEKEITKQKPKIVTEYNQLDQNAAFVILHKGTEPAGLGGYTMTKDAGTYICRQCNAQLYRAEHKFESHCGWPSFDDEIEGAVKREPDADGRRIEIVCSNCAGHLGHVFLGEEFTAKNTRHCVNSISMKFIPEGKELPPKLVIDKK